jgi:hypothetical protein
MVSCLVFFFGFITCFLPAKPNFLTKASDGVPKMAFLDAALNGKSPAHGGRDP